MYEGVLIAESLRVGATLDDVDLTVTSLNRIAISDPAPGQPPVWTLISFRTDADPDRLAAALSEALDAPGWYVDFHDGERRYVVFPAGRVFAFARGDDAGRLAALTHGRVLGIPDQQLDWTS